MTVHLLEGHLKETLGCKKSICKQVLPGSHLDASYLYETDLGHLFIKTGPLSWLANFQAEAKGLTALKKMSQLRVPFVYSSGSFEDKSCLVLEWISLLPHTDRSLKILGTELAWMHLQEEEGFGFEVNNTIGATPQMNSWALDWPTFFKTNRLSYQIDLVQTRFKDQEIVEKSHELVERLPLYFENCEIKPSLLHGDLWQGNTARDSDGRPVVFDPAAYYGHHEADLSMMSMFGGFSEAFFQAYHALIPRHPGFMKRQACYQLYHYLNHYNIFGKSYRAACLRLLDELI